MARHAAALFLGALLLFLVQPICGKALLPRFGGSPAVWTTCILFFQVVLLAGYGYAHLIQTRLSPAAQAAVHGGLLAVSLATFPLGFIEGWNAAPASAPTVAIVSILAAGVGLPYLLLSATAPLVQGWLHRAGSESAPYRLYALSNFGSLVALVAYPFALEPAVGLAAQARVWRWGYAAAALLLAWCAAVFARSGAGALAAAAEPGAPPPRRGDRFLWLALPAAGSTLLLAATNQVCQDIAIVPFLWILPLALYLLTFILCFRSRSFYRRIPFVAAFAAAACGSLVALERGVSVPILAQIASHSATLLAGAMVCHGELERLKPHPAQLTSYYLSIAAGGALGGAFVTLAAPILFRGYWELYAAILLTGLVEALVVFRDPSSRLFDGRPLWAWTVIHMALFGLVIASGVQAFHALDDAVEVSRSFHGVLRILDSDRGDQDRRRYVLMHGRIEHGFQFRSEERRLWPTSYYSLDSGIGVALRCHPARAKKERGLRVAVIGLGVGTLAVYGERGDTFRFYELDPDVARISGKYFSYRRESAASIELVLGDARLSLERERTAGTPQRFDVMAIDAFNGDSIPVHLLTREAFDLYRYHLDPDGIVAFHTSSRYLDLRPVVLGLALPHAAEGVRAVWIESASDESRGTDSSDWLLVTRNRSFLEATTVQGAITPWPSNMRGPIVWTDDYSDLFRVLSR